MANAAAKTSIGPIALIAVEQYYPEEERIVEDNLAFRMLPGSSRIFVRLLKPRWMREWIIGLSERSQPGIWGGLLCRKRYIDEKLTACAGEIETVVNLGAGFDTRCFRLPSLSGKPVWEIDQPENVRAKKGRLRQALGTIPSNVNLFSVDFDHDSLPAALEAKGYSLGRRTFFIMEAVTQYLTEDGMKATLEFLAKAARGSRLALTYVRKDFLAGTSLYGWESGYKRFVLGNVWHYAMDSRETTGLFAGYGWKVVEDRGYDELAEQYLTSSRRNLHSTPVERMVYAEKV